jgi:hypothetical protein
MMNSIQMMIENLQSIQAAKAANDARTMIGDPKHITLLKTLYGMADEMLSKNFLEDKRTNQKNLFEKDPFDGNSLTDGKALNFEELLQSLKEQLASLDFVKEMEKAEAYEDYYFEGDGDQESPEFPRHLSKESSLVFTMKEPNLTSIREEKFTKKEGGHLVPEESSSESGEEFLSSLGFKDPFHKTLQTATTEADLHDNRLSFPTGQFMTQEKLQQVDNLL